MNSIYLNKVTKSSTVPILPQRRGQQLRRELLLHLKGRGGLKYREIAKLPEFAGVKMNALGSLYRYEKMREK